MKLNRIFFLILFILPVHAEYLVFQKEGNAISSIDDVGDYDKIYNILQTYQWPMMLGSLKKIHPSELKELTKKDIENAEENFLRKKIKEISPNYDIAFIPTLIYEIFFITNISNYINYQIAPYPFEIKKLSLMTASVYAINEVFHENIFDAKIFAILSKTSSKVQTIYNYFNTLNIKIFSQNLHKMINNALVQFIKDSSSNIQEYIDHNKIDLVKHWIQVKINPWKFTFLKDDAALKKIMDIEYEARKRNVGILYRAGWSKEVYIIGRKKALTPIEGSFLATLPTKNIPAPTYQQLKEEYEEGKESTRTRDWSLPLNSVSYGNSVFAGYWEDVGACACTYLDDPTLIGYSLFIDKEKYINNKLDLFFISSLNTINSVLGEGEFFHSRTKAFATPDYFIESGGYFYVPGFQGEYDFVDNAGIFAPLGDPLEKAKELSEFIQLNARITKLPNFEFNFPYEAELKYRKAQIDLTNMLKTMITLRKYLPRYAEASQGGEPMEIEPQHGKRREEEPGISSEKSLMTKKVHMMETEK